MTSPAPTWLALFAVTAMALLLAACGSGGLSWRFEVGRHAAWSPIVVDGVVYAGSDLGEVYALDSETGRLLWNHAVETPNELTAPTIASGVFYYGVHGLSANDDPGAVGLYALDASTGARLWAFRTNSAGLRFQQLVSSPVVADGVVYFTSQGFGLGTAYLHALDALTGDLLWEVGAEHHVGTPTIAGGVAYFAAGDIRRGSHLYAVDALSGELLRRVRREGAWKGGGHGMPAAGLTAPSAALRTSVIPLRYPFRGSGHPVEAVERRPHAAVTAGTVPTAR